MKNERTNLVFIIVADLLKVGKLALLLFVLIALSALSTVVVIYNTRVLMEKKEQLMLEKEALDIEWRNLILEENVLGDHTRISQIATNKLHMQHVSAGKENIIVQ